MKYKNNGQWEEITIKALDSMPIGSIILFAGETIPNGWLVCDGDAIASATYPDLYSVIGTKYGGNSTNFNLPDLRGRVAVGLDPTDQLETFDTLGNSGGSRYLQAHNHGGSTSTNYAYDTSAIYSAGGGNNFVALTWGGNYVGDDSTYRMRTYHSHTINTDGTGNSGNLQPYLVVNYIIKALNTTPTMASVVNQTNSSTEDSYSCNYINEHYGGVVLYESANGETGNIVLSETLDNYKYIEVCFIDNDGTNGPVAKFDNANNRLNNNWISLEKSYGAYKKTKNFSISGKNLTVESGSGETFGTTFTASNNMIKVYKIIGYK